MTDFMTAQQDLNRKLIAQGSANTTVLLALISYLDTKHPGVRSNLQFICKTSSERHSETNPEAAEAFAILAEGLASKD